MNKPLLLTSCCILLALSAAGTAPLLTAQENEPESTEQQSQAAEAEAGEKAAQAEKSEQGGEAEEKESAQRNATGGFRPSEEISEDLSVSFPVDI